MYSPTQSAQNFAHTAVRTLPTRKRGKLDLDGVTSLQIWALYDPAHQEKTLDGIPFTDAEPMAWLAVSDVSPHEIPSKGATLEIDGRVHRVERATTDTSGFYILKLYV